MDPTQPDLLVKGYQDALRKECPPPPGLFDDPMYQKIMSCDSSTELSKALLLEKLQHYFTNGELKRLLGEEKTQEFAETLGLK